MYRRYARGMHEKESREKIRFSECARTSHHALNDSSSEQSWDEWRPMSSSELVGASGPKSHKSTDRLTRVRDSLRNTVPPTGTIHVGVFLAVVRANSLSICRVATALRWTPPKRGECRSLAFPIAAGASCSATVDMFQHHEGSTANSKLVTFQATTERVTDFIMSATSVVHLFAQGDGDTSLLFDVASAAATLHSITGIICSKTRQRWLAPLLVLPRPKMR